jgi:glycosyltransferase involved in cell wall biosynthesis
MRGVRPRPATDSTPIVLSVVVPMFNESENAESTLARITEACTLLGAPFELIPVNDGSTDDTATVLARLAAADTRIRPVSYTPNAGRGRALRRGFAAARGLLVASTDADLSYAPEYVPAMAQVLLDHREIDFVVGSPYIAGGGAEGVPWFRLAVSRWGNRILALAMGGRIHTVTGVLRAYRRSVLDLLELESDGKEIHLEILAKAQAAGFAGAEIPAVLRKRQKGKSKFRLRATAWSHLVFSWHERPMLLFGVIGLGVILAGLGLGAYLVWHWWQGTLNPNRPLMTLFPLLLIGGLQIVLFGFLGSQMANLRRELYKIQRQNRQNAALHHRQSPAAGEGSHRSNNAGDPCASS